MKTTSLTLIPITTFGASNGSTYDGSSPSFSSTPQKAAAYYTKDKSQQTLSWIFPDLPAIGLVGIVTIEATLDEDNTTDNYFPVHTFGDGINPINDNGFVNLEGNYTWIRVTISQFTAGSVEKVAMGY